MSRSWGIGFPGTWYFSPGVEFIPPLGHMNPATCKLIPHTAFHCRRYSLRPSDYWIIVPKLRYSTFLDGHWTFGHLCRILVGIIIPVGWAAAHPNSGSAQDYRYPLSGGRWHTWELKDSPGFRAGRPGPSIYKFPVCRLSHGHIKCIFITNCWTNRKFEIYDLIMHEPAWRHPQ